MIDYDKVLTRTVREVRPSGIRRFFDLAGSMEGVISLGVGEPDFHTPWQIRAAGIRSLEQGQTRYTANRGTLPLRQEISRYLARKYDLSYRPEDEILVTVGGSEAIDMTLRTVLEPGDEVILPQPSYVCYEPLTRLCGGVPVILNTRAENDFRVTAAELSALLTDRTKVLILPYPCNPTGAILRREDIAAIEEVLRGTNVLVLSDEIYAELTYGDVCHTAVASVPGMKERTVTINGFSKAFSMTGWRLGYACAPAPLLSQITKIHQYAIMCAPTTSQAAAVEALRSCDAEVARMREEYDDRRHFITAGFRRIGLPCREPMGAFYVFPDIRGTGMTSEEFCEKLLAEEKVAVVPGTAFGESGEGFVRVSYCYSLEHIREALRRIGVFLSRHTGDR